MTSFVESNILYHFVGHLVMYLDFSSNFGVSGIYFVVFAAVDPPFPCGSSQTMCGMESSEVASFSNMKSVRPLWMLEGICALESTSPVKDERETTCSV